MNEQEPVKSIVKKCEHHKLTRARKIIASQTC